MWKVTPTTSTPSSRASSSRPRQLFREQPNATLVSAACASVVSCSSNLGGRGREPETSQGGWWVGEAVIETSIALYHGRVPLSKSLTQSRCPINTTRCSIAKVCPSKVHCVFTRSQSHIIRCSHDKTLCVWGGGETKIHCFDCLVLSPVPR